jgi:RhtB (resistance to homoserine/threonine) family protein
MLLALLSAYVISLVALVSPGPDFAITVQSSVRHGFRAGVLTACGIACGNMIHVTYVNIGLGALIAHSVVAFNVMKLAAAAYLAWIGAKALRSRPAAPAAGEVAPAEGVADAQAFRRGLVANVLNPKAALFWLSYFTLVLDPHMPAAVLAAFIALQAVTIAAWFSFVALVMSRPAVRAKFLRLGHWFDRATGAVLIALGVKVALAQR